LGPTTRGGSTNLTQLISAGMLEAFPNTDAAIFNSGSIRIDDVLPPGPLTQYDVLRILPYPGNLMVARVTGSMLARIISVGHDASHTGTGGYLQVAGIVAPIATLLRQRLELIEEQHSGQVRKRPGEQWLTGISALEAFR